MNNGFETMNIIDSKLPTDRSKNSYTRIEIGLHLFQTFTMLKYRTWRSFVLFKIQHTRFCFCIVTTHLKNCLTFWQGAQNSHQYCLQVVYIVFQVETIRKLSEHLSVILHAKVIFTDICKMLMFILIECTITVINDVLFKRITK